MVLTPGQAGHPSDPWADLRATGCSTGQKKDEYRYRHQLGFLPPRATRARGMESRP
jgi:hypothetical protein